jgi:hypothetical protein
MKSAMVIDYITLLNPPKTFPTVHWFVDAVEGALLRQMKIDTVAAGERR